MSRLLRELDLFDGIDDALLDEFEGQAREARLEVGGLLDVEGLSLIHI